MTTSMSAFGKASAASNMKKQLVSKSSQLTKHLAYSTAPAALSNGNGSKSHKDPATQRELFMNVLTANATKRDAKQYLARFNPPKKTQLRDSKLQNERNAVNRREQDRLDRTGVNLGGLYAPARAIAETPVFSQPGVGQEIAAEIKEELHVALVCLRAPETLDDATLDGVAVTLSQLVKLDMRILVVLDRENPEAASTNIRRFQDIITAQAQRLRSALGRHSPDGARYVPGALEIDNEASAAIIKVPNLLLEPMKRSVIPIVPTLAFTPFGKLKHLSAATTMSALTRLLSGLPLKDDHRTADFEDVKTSLDRIIVLDTVGGIPSKVRNDGAHVFINLDQEYAAIKAELSEYGCYNKIDDHTSGVLRSSKQHLSNLSMVRDCLSILPSATSALIITPQEAAASSLMNTHTSIGAGTRRQKNTLIHNLLTNKPMVSSSLPVARLPSTSKPTISLPTSTLLKRGMPLTIIPSAAPGHGWLPPPTGATSLDLATDPRVDLPRLVHLIEDSFRRKLNVQHYLSRIRGRIAGLIIAGSYEGGAILTWETPPGAPPNDPTRLVPYLDKFAVLSSSQGSSGVADIVFQAMVRTCFPDGVCWRSRKDNPVNKWYFERSEGTWQIPDSNWTMFWTGQGVVEGQVRWEDYVGVCRSVGPSWAEVTAVVD